MEIYRLLTPAVLAARLSWINRAQLLVLDANIPAESIAWLCGHAQIPIFADPVSAAKAEKLRPVLGSLHTVKPNRVEAELLSGVKIRDEQRLNRAADVLLETGLHRVFLSLGADGLLAADQKDRLRLPAKKSGIVNTTGSGDAFLAALVWAYLQGTDLLDSTAAGMAAASLAMESTETINPAMSAEALTTRMQSMKNRITTEERI
jgi:pseudouridine kinase